MEEKIRYQSVGVVWRAIAMEESVAGEDSLFTAVRCSRRSGV